MKTKADIKSKIIILLDRASFQLENIFLHNSDQRYRLWWWLSGKIMFGSWKLALYNSIIMLTLSVVVVFIKINRKHHFQSTHQWVCSSLCATCILIRCKIGLVHPTKSWPGELAQWLEHWNESHEVHSSIQVSQAHQPINHEKYLKPKQVDSFSNVHHPPVYRQWQATTVTL